jgi:outer membrane lipoprotein carrier protein
LPAACVNLIVSHWVARVCVSLAAVPMLAAAPDLGHILKGVENRYNRPETMQLLFEQTYSGYGRPPRTESGELYLRKPKRMRWEYRKPPGKLFLSDGKDVYFYVPSANRVEKMKLKESADMRTPLAFLIGKLDFYRDFREFRTRPEGEDTYIVALPKSDKSPYTQVEFLVTPSYRIRRLVVKGQDQSVMEFQFTQEKLNPHLDSKLFQFKMPPGAELVETEEQGN